MPINVTCRDRDRIFQDGSPAEWNALESHAAQCPACAEEVRAWKSLSMAAQELREYADSPSLWSRVERSLAAEAVVKQRDRKRWNWSSLWAGFGFSWQIVAAGAFAVLLLISSGWIYVKHSTVSTPSQDAASLLKSKALTEVERTETAYIRAIHQLAVEARPQLENPDTPLLASYREKLLTLDSAIDDLRAQAAQNPSNAHLRYQLLAMYQEKQHTLQDVLEAKPQ
jgi:hypothetical protein